MSADGEIEVAVKAEGVDDAAEDLGEAEDGGVGGGGDGGGGGLARAGSLGRILGVLAALVSILGPILEFIKAVFAVLQAFLAPIALILIRLLTPFLRAFIQLLPAWFEFIDAVMPAVEMVAGFLSELLSREFIRNPRDLLEFALSPLPKLIWEEFKSTLTNLPSSIGDQIINAIPGISVNDEGEAGFSDGEATERALAGQTNNVVLQGGLSAFVKRIEENSGIELP